MPTEKQQQYIDKTFTEIADRIADSLKLTEGMTEDQKAIAFGQWMRSWTSLAPQNGESNRAYNGMNAFFLGLMMHCNKWENPFFLTSAGIKRLGGHILKGSKSLPVFWFKKTIIRDEETDKIVKVFTNVKIFRVFNIAQTSITADQCKKAQCEGKKLDEVEEMLKNLEIELGQGDPSYSPSEDVIRMPEIKAFKTEADYYSTLFHEMGHWTMASNRCNRTGEKKLSYAQEELVAELTACFMDAEFGIEGDLQHPEYIGSWIKGLKDHPKAFFNAVQDAQKAANFLLKKNYEAKKEETEAA